MKTKSQNTNNSQLAKANEALRQLAVNVTATDRKEAPMSEPTVVLYLKGEGKDLETAIRLLEFFKERIAKRDRLLAA